MTVTLNISIQKGTSVSIHRQLVTQLSLQIASGMRPAKSKLPSVRALSAKLGIHYNTCLAVYKELTALGLLETKKGSGVLVASFQQKASHQQLETLELQQMAHYFVQLTQAQGYAWEDVALALQMARQKTETPQQKIIFADVHADILPVFQAELENALQRPIGMLDLNQPISAMPDACYIVSRYHYKTLKTRLKTDETIIMIDVAGGQQEIERIKSLPTGSLVTIISDSTIILQMAESVISSVRGSEVLVGSLLFSDGLPDIRQAIKHAKLVVCDFLCAQQLQLHVKKRLSVIKLIPESELEKIKAIIHQAG